MLTIINGRLREDKISGKLVLSPKPGGDAPCCCAQGCKYFWFGICNINAAIDDNFNMFINGKGLGVMNLEANAQVGWVIHTGPKPPNSQISWGSCYNLAVFKQISQADLRVGSNSVTTTLAKANNNGNYGTWSAGLWAPTDDVPEGGSCPLLGSGAYGNAPGTFGWPLTQEQYDNLTD